MKLTMSQAIDINNIFTQISDQKLKLKTAYKIAKSKEVLNKEITFYNSEFSKIIDQYAQKTNGQIVYSEDKTSILIIPNKEEECMQAIKNLRELEINVEIEPFSLEEFDGIDFSINQVEALFPIIK